LKNSHSENLVVVTVEVEVEVVAAEVVVVDLVVVAVEVLEWEVATGTPEEALHLAVKMSKDESSTRLMISSPAASMTSSTSIKQFRRVTYL